MESLSTMGYVGHLAPPPFHHPGKSFSKNTKTSREELPFIRHHAVPHKCRAIVREHLRAACPTGARRPPSATQIDFKLAAVKRRSVADEARTRVTRRRGTRVCRVVLRTFPTWFAGPDRGCKRTPPRARHPSSLCHSARIWLGQTCSANL